MRVLMFGWEFPPHNSGGLGVACQGLTRALVGHNVEVTFVLPKRVSVNSGSLRFVFADIPEVRVKVVNSPLYPYLTSEGYKSYLETLGNIPQVYGNSLYDEVCRYALAAREIAKKERFDIIHAHDWLAFGAGVAAKEVSGKPLVVHVHATEFDRSGGSANPLVYEMERTGLEKADRVITVSEFTKALVSEKYGVSPEKIEVVHNGIEPEDFTVAKTDSLGLHQLKKAGYKVVLFVGRITLQKGPDYFIEAAKRVLDYCPKTYFLVVGSGDMENQMVEKAAHMGISDKVLFVGFLRGKELSDVYALADIFVMPSVSEPFGITPLESLIHGAPVLISKQSGVSEVLPNALKADFWDVDEIADEIISVLEYGSLKNTLSTNGKVDALRCTWDSAADKCVNVYRKLVT